MCWIIEQLKADRWWKRVGSSRPVWMLKIVVDVLKGPRPWLIVAGGLLDRPWPVEDRQLFDGVLDRPWPVEDLQLFDGVIDSPGTVRRLKRLWTSWGLKCSWFYFGQALNSWILTVVNDYWKADSCWRRLGSSRPVWILTAVDDVSETGSYWWRQVCASSSWHLLMASDTGMSQLK